MVLISMLYSEYTAHCANGYSGSTYIVTVAENTAQSNWSYAFTSYQCDSVTSISIETATCPEFWNISCSWPTTLTTISDAPSRSPTNLPAMHPTISPTHVPSEHPTSVAPTRSPTDHPTRDPTAKPSITPSQQPTWTTPTISPSGHPATPMTMAPSMLPTGQPTTFPSAKYSNQPTTETTSIFASCTQNQVVLVHAAMNNTIFHQQLCFAAKRENYIVDTSAQKPYYINQDSNSSTVTMLNMINVSDFGSGKDSNVPATASVLIGKSIIYMERWRDVLAYLGLNLNGLSTTQSVLTSIKIDELNITTNLSAISRNEFKQTLKTQIVSELSVDSNQVNVVSLRSGSIVAEIEILSNASNEKSASEIDIDLQNYIASKDTSTASMTSPLNTINNFFYYNESNDIMFTDCPYQITSTITWLCAFCRKGWFSAILQYSNETVPVEWDTPGIKSRVDDDSISVVQVIGAESGDAFQAGTHFIRYVAVSENNASITPKYCSFVVVVGML